jgi:hypothetical protein
VRDAFARLGWDAWSCDLLPADGQHIQNDVTKILLTDTWDLMIAHPPCTYLAVSGMHWTTRGFRPKQLTEDALDFVRVSKRTCLWLKDLPALVPTEYVEPERYVDGKPRWSNQAPCGADRTPPSADRWRTRSKTHQGIADAMAEQWTQHIAETTNFFAH